MGFPSFFFKKKQKKYYFGLYLKSESATGFVFQEENSNISILMQQTVPYSNGWEQILEDSDTLISELENKAGEPLDEVIFFLPSYFVDISTGDIKRQYKDIIKNISKTLELKPLGFIELHEAVKNVLQKRNQEPLNTVFVEMDSAHGVIYGYKGGKSILTHQTARSDDLVEDLTEAFKTVESGLLPAKITLYGSGDLLSQAKILESAVWAKETFLHPPQIEVIKEQELPETFRTVFAEQVFSNSATDAAQPGPSAGPAPDTEHHEEILGFVVGEDIRDIEPPPPTVDFAEDSSVGQSKQPFKFNFSMPGISLPFKLGMPQKKGGIVMAVLVLIIFVGGFFAFEYFLHKMKITVYLPAEEFEKTIDLSAPVSKTGDNNFYVKLSEVSKPLVEETKTTGEQEVGQKAKGSVVISNAGNSEKTVTKATEVTYGELVYVFDQDVKVVAGKITTGGDVQAGKTKTTVTASKIGSEYNIEKGKQLKIAGSSDSLYAVAEEAFTGGTKKKVKTVARVDIDKLKTSASAKAKAEGQSQLKNVSSGEQVLGDLTKIDVEDPQYSKEIGEEGDVLGLKAKANIEYYTYPVDTFKDALISSLTADAPEGFTVQSDKIDYKVKRAKKTNNTVTLSVDTKVDLVKDIPKDELAKKIAGKSSSQVSDIVRKEYQALETSIDDASPTTVFFGNWTPLFDKNISVTISSK